MKVLMVIPAVLIVGLLLVKKVKDDEADIVLQDTVQEKIVYYAESWGLEVALVRAIAKVESNFNPEAKNPADPSFGLMQITPILAEDYGLISDYRNMNWLKEEMIFDINNNLNVACWYLKKLSKYNFSQQVQSYNVGEWGYKTGVRNLDYLGKVREAYERYS